MLKKLYFRCREPTKECLLNIPAGTILLIVIVVTIVVAVKKSKNYDVSSSHTNEFKAEKYENAAVASDAALCSKVGAAILKKKGSAIDSAIATTFCLGVVNLHSCGIGGPHGFLQACYQEVYCLRLP